MSMEYKSTIALYDTKECISHAYIFRLLYSMAVVLMFMLVVTV